MTHLMSHAQYTWSSFGLFSYAVVNSLFILNHFYNFFLPDQCMSQYLFINLINHILFYSEAILQILFQLSSKRCSWNHFSLTIKQNCLVILEVRYSSAFRNFSFVILELPSISSEIRNLSCGCEKGCSTFRWIIS